MRLDIHHHADQRVIDKLDMILATQEILMDNLDRLIDDVAKQKTVIASMQTFISGLKSQVAEALAGAKLSPEVNARLASIFPDLEANTDAIAAAITDNTPVAAPANPDPVPPVAPAPPTTSAVDPGPAGVTLPGGDIPSTSSTN